jgi:hypothetical protein
VSAFCFEWGVTETFEMLEAACSLPLKSRSSKNKKITENKNRKLGVIIK